jgi:hypothetical protein
MPRSGPVRARDDRAAVAVRCVHQRGIARLARLRARGVQHQRGHDGGGELHAAAGRTPREALHRGEHRGGEAAERRGARDRREDLAQHAGRGGAGPAAGGADRLGGADGLQAEEAHGAAGRALVAAVPGPLRLDARPRRVALVVGHGCRAHRHAPAAHGDLGVRVGEEIGRPCRMPRTREVRARHDRAALSVGGVHERDVSGRPGLRTDGVEHEGRHQECAQLHPPAREAGDEPFRRREQQRSDDTPEHPGAGEGRDECSHRIDDAGHESPALAVWARPHHSTRRAVAERCPATGGRAGTIGR